MKPLIIATVILSTLISYAQAQKEKIDYPRQVADIAFDATQDDPNFKLCYDTMVFQYYNFGKGVQYKGEKPKIIEHFKNGFKARNKIKGSGYVTIRFIVSCEGKLGRFRVEGMTEDYAPKEFNKEITTQLVNLTKKMDGWIIGDFDGVRVDYYQYLTFKIQNGQLIEIMP